VPTNTFCYTVLEAVITSYGVEQEITKNSAKTSNAMFKLFGLSFILRKFQLPEFGGDYSSLTLSCNARLRFLRLVFRSRNSLPSAASPP